MKAFAQPKVSGAQRSWFGAVFTGALESLPSRVREVLADPETRDRLDRMDPGAAFGEVRAVLIQMEHLAKELMFDNEQTERCCELFDAIDALAALPGPDGELHLEATDAHGRGGFLAAFLALERMALEFERRQHLDEIRLFRRGLDALPSAPTVDPRAVQTVARPRERRDSGARRSSTRAGPSDDEGLAEPEGRDDESRPRDLLFTDARQYLARLGSAGAERDWLVEQIASLGYSRERVGAALAVLCSEGLARRGRGDDGETVVWGEL